MCSVTDRVINTMLSMQRYPWEQRVCAQALYEYGRDDLWIPMAYDAVKRMGQDGRLAMIGGEPAVSDPASCGEICIRAYEKTKDPFFKHGADCMLDYLLNAAPRTEDGIICHNNVSFEEGFSPYQLWVDGIYMVPPFLAAMGMVEEAWIQILGYRKYLYDDECNLFYHIYDVEQKRFVRKKHWATGNGWALLGLLRVMEEADCTSISGPAKQCRECFLELLNGMLNYRLEDGRFRDILDDETSFIDGTSAMMVSAAIFRAAFDGILSDDLCDKASRAIGTVSGTIDEYGLLRQVCGCPDFQSEGTSAEAQAAYIMANAWRNKYYKRNT